VFGLRELAATFIHPTAWLVGIFLILLGSDFKQTFRSILAFPYLIIVSLVVFALYCLTTIQGRFLPAWELLIWGSLLTAAHQRRSIVGIYRAVTAFVCLAMIGAVAYMIYGETIHGFHNDATTEYEIAEGLQEMALQPGENVAAIGFGIDAHWAYLDRLNIVAEINPEDTCGFWNEPADIQAQVMEKFAQAGVDVVVANTGTGIRTTSQVTPLDLSACAHPGNGWRKIPGTLDQAFFLK
jgi:hypothetical protein